MKKSFMGMFLLLALTSCQKQDSKPDLKQDEEYLVSFGVSEANDVAQYIIVTIKDTTENAIMSITPIDMKNDYSITLKLESNTKLKVRAIEKDGQRYDSQIVVAK